MLKKWEELPKYMRTEAVRPYYESLSRKKFSLWIKRVFDVTVASVMLALLSPVLLVLAFLIAKDSKGGVFYRQERVTQYGRKFRIFKFRTMVANADKIGTQVTVQNDNRITKIGEKLRKYRLDELPQLFNIWKGEMSIVGPRPERPELAEEIEEEIPEFCYRLKMKAGLTGYAQVYGKYNTTSYDKLKLDLTYIRNYSLLLDLKLMLMTPKIMMLKESTEGVADNGNASDSRHPGV